MNFGLLQQFAVSCSNGSFLGFPKWYKYLDGTIDSKTGLCSPQLTSLSDVWLIVAAGIEILLQVAALAAVYFVLYGGISYIMSQGEPDKTTAARHTIINALVGLAICTIAATTVGFIAGRFH